MQIPRDTSIDSCRTETITIHDEDDFLLALDSLQDYGVVMATCLIHSRWSPALRARLEETVKLAEDVMVLHDIFDVFTVVLPDNPLGVKFNERLGFKVIERADKYILLHKDLLA